MNVSLNMNEKIYRCEQIIGYSFLDRALAAEALNAGATSWSGHDGTFQQLAKNDRLAVYGDIAAAKSLCRPWYFAGSRKGTWTHELQSRLSNRALANAGFQHNLDACVTMNHGTVQVSNKMMATAVEALLGAIELDGGDEALAGVMEHLGIADGQPVLAANRPQFPVIRAPTTSWT